MRCTIPGLLLFAMFSLTSCLTDPCIKGTAPCYPSSVWEGPIIPPCAFDDLGQEEDEPPVENHILSIAQVVDVALRNHPATRQTWANARSAAFNWEASKSNLYPSIQAQETLQFEKSHFGRGSSSGVGVTNASGNASDSALSAVTGTSGGGGLQGYQQEVMHNISASYLLLDFGGRDALIDSAKNALFASNWTHNRAIQSVVIGALSAYYNFINAKALLESGLATLADAKKNKEAAEAQFEVGVVTIVDVLLAKSNFVNAELAVEQYRGQVSTTLGQLASAMGLQANVIFDVEPLPEVLPVEQVTEGVDELVEAAKMQRADLAAAYATYIQKQADLDVARSDGKPIISANLNWERNVFIHSPNNNSHFYTGSIVLDIPIFSGFLYANLERKAKADVQSAYAAMLNAESAVLLEVVTSYYALKTAVETLKSSEEYLKYAQEAYNAAYENYREGTGTLLDVLAGFDALANARTKLVQARTQWVTALANLSYATGIL